jgi:hypothetical protein
MMMAMTTTMATMTMTMILMRIMLLILMIIMMMMIIITMPIRCVPADRSSVPTRRAATDPFLSDNLGATGRDEDSEGNKLRDPTVRSCPCFARHAGTLRRWHYCGGQLGTTAQQQQRR